MAILHQFFVAFLSSGLVVGVAVFLLRKWISARIELNTMTQLETLKSALEVNSRVSEDVLKRYMEGTISIAEVVYRCRNHTRAIASSLRISDEIAADELGGLIENTYKVTDYLYRYGILLRDEQFERIHKYKRTMQRLVIAVDDITRGSSHASARAAFLALEPEVERQFQEIRNWIKSDPRLNTVLDG